MSAKEELEYKELKKMAEKAGIADLAKISGKYKELMDMSYRYLEILNPKFVASTLDCSA
jgi:hypothetical protein